jgi:hypothetical protein
LLQDFAIIWNYALQLLHTHLMDSLSRERITKCRGATGGQHTPHSAVNSLHTQREIGARRIRAS